MLPRRLHDASCLLKFLMFLCIGFKSILGANLGGMVSCRVKHFGSRILSPFFGPPRWSARGSQKAATEAVCEGLWAPWGGSGTGLGRVWDAQGTFLEQNLIPNLISLLQASLKPFFWNCKANIYVFLFLPTLRIQCNLQWILHVFRFELFQNKI